MAPRCLPLAHLHRWNQRPQVPSQQAHTSPPLWGVLLAALVAATTLAGCAGTPRQRLPIAVVPATSPAATAQANADQTPISSQHQAVVLLGDIHHPKLQRTAIRLQIKAAQAPSATATNATERSSPHAPAERRQHPEDGQQILSRVSTPAITKALTGRPDYTPAPEPWRLEEALYLAREHDDHFREADAREARRAIAVAFDRTLRPSSHLRVMAAVAAQDAAAALWHDGRTKAARAAAQQVACRYRHIPLDHTRHAPRVQALFAHASDDARRSSHARLVVSTDVPARLYVEGFLVESHGTKHDTKLCPGTYRVWVGSERHGLSLPHTVTVRNWRTARVHIELMPESAWGLVHYPKRGTGAASTSGTAQATGTPADLVRAPGTSFDPDDPRDPAHQAAWGAGCNAHQCAAHLAWLQQRLRGRPVLGLYAAPGPDGAPRQHSTHHLRRPTKGGGAATPLNWVDDRKAWRRDLSQDPTPIKAVTLKSGASHPLLHVFRKPQFSLPPPPIPRFSWAYAIPFGGGQWVQSRPLATGVVLGIQGALLGTHVAALAEHQRAERQARPDAGRWRVFRHVSGGLFYGSILAGIVEAIAYGAREGTYSLPYASRTSPASSERPPATKQLALARPPRGSASGAQRPREQPHRHPSSTGAHFSPSTPQTKLVTARLGSAAQGLGLGLVLRW